MAGKVKKSDIRLCDIPRFNYRVGKGSYKSSDASVAKYAKKAMASCGNDPVKACDKVGYMVCLTPSLDKRHFLNAVVGYYYDFFKDDFIKSVFDDYEDIIAEKDSELAEKDRELTYYASELLR